MVAGVHEREVAQPTAIQQLKIHAAGVAEFHDRRRCECEGQRVAIFGKRQHGAPGNRFGTEVGPIPQFPILQFHEDQAIVLGPA